MRLFIATSFPETVTRELNSRIAAVKSRLPSASWVKPESQHLTFAFLGERDESIVEKLAPSIDAGLHQIKKFEAVVRDCGFFPNPRHARVGWAGLDPEQPFRDIAAIVREVVTSNGVELDGGEFRPHLTLMRIRDRWPPASIETFEKTLRDYKSAPFTVDTVTLFSSRLNPTGAIHTPMRHFTLA
jgi:RNA 2',3'-cyclic 3'-phosphodiesterase